MIRLLSALTGAAVALSVAPALAQTTPTPAPSAAPTMAVPQMATTSPGDTAATPAPAGKVKPVRARDGRCNRAKLTS